MIIVVSVVEQRVTKLKTNVFSIVHSVWECMRRDAHYGLPGVPLWIPMKIVRVAEKEGLLFKAPEKNHPSLLVFLSVISTVAIVT